MLQHRQPCGSRVFRIQVKITLQQGRLDIGGSAADSLGDFHLNSQIVLYQLPQDFCQDILLRHGLGGDLNGFL